MLKLVFPLAGLVAIAACTPAFPADTKSPGMDGYYQWLQECLGGIKQDVPAITASAETAAELFVKQGYDIGAWGDEAFCSEFRGRAGGLMPVSYLRRTETTFSKCIVLFAPQQDTLTEDLDVAKQMKRPDNLLILFGGPKAVSSAQKLAVPFDAVINTHAAPHGGLFQDKTGACVVPTDRAASIAAMWAWTGEFVAACTRLGRMPVMWQSLSCPGAEARARKYQKKRFHEETPKPIERGKLGSEYIDAVSSNLKLIYAQDKTRLVSVADAASAAVKGGHRFYVAGLGHATEVAHDKANNPGEFTFLPGRSACPAFGKGDFLFCVGYDAKYQEEAFGEFSRKCREAGGGVAWSISTYGQKTIPCIEPKETLIDQRWALGDAVVSVPGYDIKILPSSGVIGDALVWMVAAEALARRD